VEALDSVVLHFFVAPDGELRCRATDIQSRRTWIVPSARTVHELLHAEPGQVRMSEKEEQHER
jgi:hypothetical protein